MLAIISSPLLNFYFANPSAFFAFGNDSMAFCTTRNNKKAFPTFRAAVPQNPVHILNHLALLGARFGAQFGEKREKIIEIPKRKKRDFLLFAHVFLN
jgi:hypothetical protein